jgi:hypothetical protein
MQRIIVGARSKFGVLDAQTNKWVNTQDKGLLASLVVGKAYDITIDTVNGDDGRTRKQMVKAVMVNTDGGNVATEVKSDVEKAIAANQAPTKKAFVPKAGKPADAPVEKVDWAAKDRSQLVGGRSHDAVELVAASLSSCTPMPKVLELYKEALLGILKLSDEIK